MQLEREKGARSLQARRWPLLARHWWRPTPATAATLGFLLTVSTHGALKGFSRTETWEVGSIGKVQIDLSANTTTVKPPCYVAHNGKIAWEGGARWGPKMPKCGILGKMCIKKEPR